MTLLALKLGTLVAAPVMLLAAAMGPQLLVVDIREGGPEGHRLFVPIPLVALQAGAALAPDDAVRIEVQELERVRPAAVRFLTELRRISDGELVRVEERGETISVRKLGDELRVDVRDGADHVRVKVPIAGLAEILRRSEGGELELGDALAVLGAASRGDLVYVRSGDDVVKVKIW
ncbi:MAG: hypothetical protein ABR599_05335 [Gemmatimonadota bacterium]